ncbi:MAG TPA: hypothetical protein V6C52_09655 [Coleofasciculaceae cyanobacterium]|jgi:hypothetical protein
MTLFSAQKKFSSIVSGMMTGVLALSCIGLLATGGLMLGGCAGGNTQQAAEQKDETLQMEVAEINQLTSIGDKTADGQFMIARILMKNNGNETVVLNPDDFKLENITEKPEERYTQPAEKFITMPFGKTYGTAAQDKLMDVASSNLYPRLQLERYFVFMVPAEAKADQYQITYTPKSLSAPLVSSSTIVNDHRNEPSSAQP